MQDTFSLSRHWRVFQIHIIDVLQFRLRSLVWLLIGAVNTIIILLFWWATLQAGGPDTGSIQIPEITSYYVLILLFASIGISHIEEDIAYRDIKKGDLYGYLLKPYPYILKKFQEEVVWRLLSAVWAVVVLSVLIVGGLTLSVSFHPLIWILTALSLLLGLVCSFFMKVCLGLLSIWLTNLSGVMNVYGILEIILAGFVIPLSLFPEQIKSFVLLSPFAASVYYPLQLFTTLQSPKEIAWIFLFQLAWTVVFFLLSRFIFHKGIRYYTGVSQ